MLRVFPTVNTFTFNTNRSLTPQEKVSFAQYLSSEGFLDDPSAPGPQATDIEQVS